MYTVEELGHTYYWKVVARHYPAYAVIVVASVDTYVNSFAVYMGALPDQYRDQDLQWIKIALDGMKQEEEVAKAYFPHLADLSYRR